MRRQFLILTLLLGIIVFPITYIFNKKYHRWVRSNPKRYCYQLFQGPPNPVLIIKDLKFKENLVEYYEIIEEKPFEEKSIGVPLKMLPPGDEVYVLEYTSDSLLAKVVSYFDRGSRLGGNYLCGWVYCKTLHLEPPNSSP